MVIPRLAVEEELHKAHALLEEPTRHQAVAAEIFGFIFVEAVALEAEPFDSLIGLTLLFCIDSANVE